LETLNSQPFKKKPKLYWRDHASKAWAFICPHCTSPRKIPYQPRPTLRHYAQIGVTAAFFTLLTWQWFGLKGMVSFLPFWITFETLYRSKVRGAMLCPHCGFDPYLYLVDVKRARAEIETHWRRKFAEKGVPFPEKAPPPEPSAPPSSGILLASNQRKTTQ
jgi:hypothetical protein